MSDIQTPDKPEPKSLTPALVTDVSFGEEISQFKASLANRKQLTENAKKAWQAFAEVLRNNGVEVPYRRVNPDKVGDYVNKIVVYKSNKEALEKLRKERDELMKFGSSDSGLAYYLLRQPTALAVLEAEFPGLEAFVKARAEKADEAHKAYNEAYNDQDEHNVEATEAARKQAREAAIAYVDAVETLEANNDEAKNVGQYIDTVEKIANISAVANGTKRK